MLRFHFSPGDVGRVRMAGEPDPMWETVYSVFRMSRPAPAIFGPFRRHALTAYHRDDLAMLFPLIRRAYYPDFLTPAEGRRSIDLGVEALLSTPAERLRRDMAELASVRGPHPGWLRLLAQGDVETLHRVAQAFRSHHEAVVAPFWTDAQAHVEAERSRRARILLEEGTEGLLDSFRPMMHWRPPVLEVETPIEREIHLDGRGLLLLPSYLSWGLPDFLRDTTLPPVLVYPVEHDLSMTASSPMFASEAVEALIGRTRASVLESIGDGSTTTELARRVGVSAASISMHTAVLREARLIRTSRAGKAVLHTVTPLGAALLDGSQTHRQGLPSRIDGPKLERPGLELP